MLFQAASPVFTVGYTIRWLETFRPPRRPLLKKKHLEVEAGDEDTLPAGCFAVERLLAKRARNVCTVYAWVSYDIVKLIVFILAKTTREMPPLIS